jgi:hypothetical protein
MGYRPPFAAAGQLLMAADASPLCRPGETAVCLAAESRALQPGRQAESAYTILFEHGDWGLFTGDSHPWLTPLPVFSRETMEHHFRYGADSVEARYARGEFRAAFQTSLLWEVRPSERLVRHVCGFSMAVYVCSEDGYVFDVVCPSEIARLGFNDALVGILKAAGRQVFLSAIAAPAPSPV